MDRRGFLATAAALPLASYLPAVDPVAEPSLIELMENDSGLLMVGGCSPPPDGMRGFSAGCIFIHTLTGEISVNAGNHTGCRFREVRT